MRRPRIVFAATVMLAVLLAGTPALTAAQRSAGCGKAAPGVPGQSIELSYEHAALSRSYRLHLPPDYDSNRQTPLVLSIHGYTGSAKNSDGSWTGLSKHADENGYIVVYPQSTSFRAEVGGQSTKITSWNDLACSARLEPERMGPLGLVCAEDATRYPCPPECESCGPCNWCSCYDDVGAIEQLLDQLEDTLCLDRDQTYALGYSNGGMFVHRLGCALPERFAAVAPMHGYLARGFSCSPPDTTAGPALLLFGGTLDRTVPFDGTPASDGFYYTSMSDVATSWAAHHQCSANPGAMNVPFANETNELSCYEHQNCGSGSQVIGCTWKGAHDWPRTGESEWGNDLLWSFFSREGARRTNQAKPP